jgi:hypothetical protein
MGETISVPQYDVLADQDSPATKKGRWVVGLLVLVKAQLLTDSLSYQLHG